MSKANLHASGKIRRLGQASSYQENVTASDVTDPLRLSRAIQTLMRAVSSLTSQWNPRRVDFVDVVVDATGTKLHPLSHRFQSRVVFFVVDWSSSTASGPSLRRHTSTDENTLVLVSDVAGTATVRVEESGA